MPAGDENVHEKGKPWQFSKENQPAIQGNVKRTKHRSTIVRRWLEVMQEFKNPITGEIEMLEQQDIITLRMIKAARDGDVAAYKELMDSAYGKAVTTLDINPADKLVAPPLIVYNTAPPLLDKEPDENEITPSEDVTYKPDNV